MNKFNSRSMIIFIILGIVVFTVLIFYGDYHEVLKSIHLITPQTVLILVALTFMNYIFRFLKWQYFLKVLNIKTSFKNSFLIFFSGLAMSITPGKVGEILKSYLLKQTDKVKMKKSLMIVFTERVTDVIGLALLSLLGISSFFFHLNSIFLILVVIIAMIITLTNEKIFFKLSGIAEKFPVVGKYARNMEEVYKSSKALMSVKSLTFSILISVVSWFFECLALYVLLLNLGTPLSIFNSTFIFSFSSIFGAVLVLPGGLGAAEGSFLALLLLSGLPKTIAVLATIIIRICTLWFGFVLGLISFFLLNRRLGKP